MLSDSDGARVQEVSAGVIGNAQLLDAFAVDFEPANAWHVGGVSGKGSVAWITEGPVSAEVEPHDPAAFWRRVSRALLKLLPIDRYL